MIPLSSLFSFLFSLFSFLLAFFCLLSPYLLHLPLLESTPAFHIESIATLLGQHQQPLHHQEVVTQQAGWFASSSWHSRSSKAWRRQTSLAQPGQSKVQRSPKVRGRRKAFQYRHGKNSLGRHYPILRA